MHDEVPTYAARKASLVASLKAPHNADAAPLGLSKRTSTLFRARDEGTKRRLDLSDLNHVIEVDTPHSWVDVEGMTCYEESGRRDSDTRRDAGGVAAAETHHGRRRRGRRRHRMASSPCIPIASSAARSSPQRAA